MNKTEFDKEDALPFEFRHIVAVDRNNVIGDGESLLWRHRGDMAHFRHLTEYGTVLMGYNTYKSIPKALVNRRMIVLTSDKSKVPTDDRSVIAISSLDELIAHVPPFSIINVIGGGAVYHMTLPMVTAISISRLDLEVEGENLIYYPTSTRDEGGHGHDYTFVNNRGDSRGFVQISADSYPAKGDDAAWTTELYFG